MVNFEKIEALYQLELGTKHSEQLIDLIDHVFQMTGYTLDDLAGFAVSIGPGSFTGLRIGVSVVKGLAFAANKPVVSVSTLDALAASCAYYPHLVCPMINARRKEVYTALYRCDEAFPVRMTDISAEKPDEWLDKLAAKSENILFLGDGAELYATLIYKKLGDHANILPVHLQRGFVSSMGMVGLHRLQQNQTEDIASFEPLYIRPADAILPQKQSFLQPSECSSCAD